MRHSYRLSSDVTLINHCACAAGIRIRSVGAVAWKPAREAAVDVQPVRYERRRHCDQGRDVGHSKRHLRPDGKVR